MGLTVLTGTLGGLLAALLIACLVALGAALLLRRWVHRSRELRTALEARVRLLQDHLDAAQDRQESLSRSLKVLDATVGELRAARDQSVAVGAAHERARGIWKGRYLEAVGKHNDLVRRYNLLQETARALKQENQQLSSQATAFSQQLQNPQDEIQRLLLDKQGLEGQIAALNQEVRAVVGQAVDLREQLEQANRTHEELMRQGTNLQGKLADLEQRKQTLHHQVTVLQEANEASIQETKHHEQTILSLQDQNRQLEGRVQLLEGQCQSLDANNKELQQEVERENQKSLELKRQCQASRQENEQLRGENQKLCEKLKQLEQDLQEFRKRLSAVTVQPEGPIKIPASFSGGHVHLGLDFGTHSTKLIARFRSDNKARVLFLDDPSEGYPAFAAPSLVRLKDGKLYFGKRALQMSGGHLYRSLKVDLLPPSPAGQWGNATYPDGPLPDLLVALYLTWVLGRVKDAFSEKETFRSTLNVAAPMDHLEDQRLKYRYLQVVQAAWEATCGTDTIAVHQGVELNTVGPQFKLLLGRSVPDHTVRQFEILPETLAPLVSLRQDPKTGEGLHLMIDMGAGTTELSISLLVKDLDATGIITCYFDRSTLLGGDNFTDNDTQNQANPGVHATVEAQLRDKLVSEIKAVWVSGFQKDKDAGRGTKEVWKRLQVVLSGGGLRRNGLEAAIKSHCPMYPFLPEDRKYNITWHSPVELDFVGGPVGFNPEAFLAYLAVAHGLSVQRPKWPTLHFPKGVTVLPPPPVKDDALNHRYTQTVE